MNRRFKLTCPNWHFMVLFVHFVKNHCQGLSSTDLPLSAKGATRGDDTLVEGSLVVVDIRDHYLNLDDSWY